MSEMPRMSAVHGDETELDRDGRRAPCVHTSATLGGVTPRTRSHDLPASCEGLPDGHVAELPPGSSGVWRITSGKSVHIIDLDAVPPTYQRVPSEPSRPFDTDGTLHELTRVELWPTLGWRFVFRFQDPSRPHEWERWHATSPVRSIERVNGPDHVPAPSFAGDSGVPTQPVRLPEDR